MNQDTLPCGVNKFAFLPPSRQHPGIDFTTRALLPTPLPYSIYAVRAVESRLMESGLGSARRPTVIVLAIGARIVSLPLP